MGQYYESQEQFYQIYKAFLKAVTEDKAVASKLASANMIIRFGYEDPDGWITIHMGDASAPSKISVEFGDEKPVEQHKKPDVTMVQSGDFSHRFWHGMENAATAIIKRKVRASGNHLKALKLIPAIRPTFRIYPKVLEELGYGDKVLKR